MGIEILPLVIDKIQKGDTRLISFINKLARKDMVDKNPTRESVLAWWDENKDFYTFPPVEDSSNP